jgi:hypothetical protein
MSSITIVWFGWKMSGSHLNWWLLSGGDCICGKCSVGNWAVFDCSGCNCFGCNWSGRQLSWVSFVLGVNFTLAHSGIPARYRLDWPNESSRDDDDDGPDGVSNQVKDDAPDVQVLSWWAFMQWKADSYKFKGPFNFNSISQVHLFTKTIDMMENQHLFLSKNIPKLKFRF